MKTPKAVLLDLFGTIFCLDPLGERLQAAGLPASSLKLWFARLLRDAWALEVVGQYRPFREVAAAALEVVAVEHGVAADKKTLDSVLDAFSDLPAHPDVKPALERMRERGITLATLGNGSAETAKALLEKNGLAKLVELRMSIDEVRHWKPHVAVYQHAVRKLGCPPAQVTLIAAHAWDIMGAKSAGLQGAWVARLEKRFEPVMGDADVSGETFAEVVEKLLS